MGDKIGKTVYLTVTISFFLYLMLVGVNVVASTTGKGELLVTFKLKQKPMNKVVDMITTQTGYAVHLEKDITNLPISGVFNSVNVISFFNKALRGKNPFIIISPKEKTITVRTAGSSNLIGTATNRPGDKFSITDKSGLVESGKEHKDSELLSGTKQGGVYELDNKFPIEASSNKNHLIDSQTGKSWDEAEELLK